MRSVENDHGEALPEEATRLEKDALEHLCELTYLQRHALAVAAHHMFGYCYLQYTDVYLEQNGIYTFDRGAKFDLERLRRVQQREAAIERAGGSEG